MAESKKIVSQISIKVDGDTLPGPVNSQLLDVVVDQSVHLPAMFVLRLYDRGLTLLDSGRFDLTRSVEISSRTADGKIVKLISGEITSIEPEFGEGIIAELTIRGYDRSHRMFREKKSATYLNVKDSDLASQIAKKNGLTAKVDATATVYEHIYQHNQSDLEFLRERAYRIGYECFVSGEDLVFRKPSSRQVETSTEWGVDLLSFNPRISLSEQVNEVWVKGWDVQKKTAITGRAENGKLYPNLKNEPDGKSWSQKLGGISRNIIVTEPVVSQAEADIVATARLDELSGAFVDAEGQVFRRPDIVAGIILKIEGLGKRLSGNYFVTRSVHHYNASGLTTKFTVTGSRTGLLLEQFGNHKGARSWPALVTALVTNTDDPEQSGRVKVKYPWMSDDEESNWMRIISPGAGPECGLISIPEVDDEVVVGFQHGDFNSPILLGGVWNGLDAIPAQTANAASGEGPLVRSWTSRTGHRITTFDNVENKVEVVTNGKHSLILDDAGKKIVIKSANGLELLLDDNGNKISVSSAGEIEVMATTGLTLKGLNVKVEAKANLDLQASGNVSVKGAMISLG